MAEKIRWGILSTGGIARKFAEALAFVPDAELVAVGSRDRDTAQTFGAQYNVPHRHATYEALAADPDVDVVYIGSPHPMHAPNSLLCMEGGKAVLCEKPFTLNATQARQLVETARSKKLFLMEAMWTRYIPVMMRVFEMIGEGVLGEPRTVIADFGFRRGYDPAGRLLNPDLGGGALLDVGVYCISLAFRAFGAPTDIASTAYIGPTGVDEQSSMLFSYPGGKIANLSCSVHIKTPQQAVIAGTKGYVQIRAPWWKPERFVLALDDQPEQEIEMPFVGNGYNYEAAEVNRCLKAGLLESPIMPLDETISIMETLDRVRAPWGLVYPGERTASAQ